MAFRIAFCCLCKLELQLRRAWFPHEQSAVNQPNNVSNWSEQMSTAKPGNLQ